MEGLRVVMCKKCGSESVIKSGIVAGRQRFCCKRCRCNFRVGDNRTDEGVAVKKLLCVLLHFFGNDSFRSLGKLFQVDHTLVYRWVREFDENLSTQVYSEVKRVDVDVLRHFVSVNKGDFNSSKLLTVAHGELWSGCLAPLILQLPEFSVTRQMFEKLC